MERKSLEFAKSKLEELSKWVKSKKGFEKASDKYFGYTAPEHREYTKELKVVYTIILLILLIHTVILFISIKIIKIKTYNKNTFVL